MKHEISRKYYIKIPVLTKLSTLFLHYKDQLKNICLIVFLCLNNLVLAAVPIGNV